MKTISQLSLFLLFACASLTVGAQDDAISKFFNQYVNDDAFTVVYISPKMFDLFTKMDLHEMADVKDDPDAKAALEIIQGLKGLRVLTTEAAPMKYFQEAKTKIPTGEYDLLMTVRDQGDENVEIFTKDSSEGTISELLIMVGGSDEFVLLSIVGDIDLKKISRLGKVMDVKGAEHLEKVGEK